MSGPNVQTWYALLMGWWLSWAAGDWAAVVLLVAGIAAVIADAHRTTDADQT